MSADFYRVLPFAGARDVKRVEREKALRLYCTAARSWWSLQIRTSKTNADGREGKEFIVAVAALNRESMTALRDAINNALQEE